MADLSAAHLANFLQINGENFRSADSIMLVIVA